MFGSSTESVNNKENNKLQIKIKVVRHLPVLGTLLMLMQAESYFEIFQVRTSTPYFPKENFTTPQNKRQTTRNAYPRSHLCTL